MVWCRFFIVVAIVSVVVVVVIVVVVVVVVDVVGRTERSIDDSHGKGHECKSRHTFNTKELTVGELISN